MAIDAHIDAIATLKSHVGKMGRKIAEKSWTARARGCS